MSNKIIVPIIIVLSLVTMGVASLTQLNKAPGKVAMNNSQSSESVWSIKSQVDSGSSQNVSKVTESSYVSSPQAEQTKSEVVTIPKPETVDGSKVTYIDRNNPPQYIKDYLACETKDLPQYYGRFIVEDSKYMYKCPPTLKQLNCKNSVVYYGKSDKDYKTNNGWLCDIAMGLPFECDIQLNKVFRSQDSSEINKVLKQKYKKARSIGDDCLVFVNATLTNQEIELFQKEIPDAKLIIYNNSK